MTKLTPSFTACAALILLCVGVTPQANAALMVSNFTLPDGSPGFDLIGIQPGPPNVGIQPGPPTGFVVGFNPHVSYPANEVPVFPPDSNPTGNFFPTGNPDLMPTLDLANAGSDYLYIAAGVSGMPILDSSDPTPLPLLLNNPSTGSAFSIFWGMYPPDPGRPSIQFNLPMNATGGLQPPNPNADGSFSYSFGATDGTNNFDIFFLITGSTPLDALSWGMVAPPDPIFPAVQFNFSFQSPGDPTLSFIVYENGQQLNFSPAPAVPEPETYAMLLAGLGLLGFTARRRKGVSRQAAQRLLAKGVSRQAA